MKRTHLNALIDATAFVAFLLLLSTGLLLEYQLPAGSGDFLDPKLLQDRDSKRSLYVICQKGGRGKLACERLTAAGVANVVNVEGGTEACIAAGLPVVRGKTTVSLERQVRIAAGSLVLLGLLLAWLVHPAFVALSAFVGAGLVFAGITDTCGMGMLLARMPWNQLGTNRQTSCTTNKTSSDQN